jgi:hypothetical protein
MRSIKANIEAKMADQGQTRTVQVTSTAKTFWLGGTKEATPEAGGTPVLLVRGNLKALEEARKLLELQEREGGLEVAKW